MFIYITPDNSRTRAQANPEMDSSERRKSGLNLPAGMSETSLRLETFSGSYRAISNLSSPSKATSCSDRFIPCRSSSRLHTFGLIEKASPVKEGGNEAYFRLLKQELFGSDFGSSSPAGQGSPMSPSKNMLRFKTDHSGPNSPFSPSIFGPDSGFSSEASTPPKPPRKVPKTPHKVSRSIIIFVLESVWFLRKHSHTTSGSKYRKRSLTGCQMVAGSGCPITSR